MRNYSAGRKVLSGGFALLFGMAAACNPQKATQGDIEFAGTVKGKRVFYNEGVAMPIGMPLANRMIVPEGSLTFTLYDVTDRVPITEPRDARLERICVADGSHSEQCYRTDGTAFYTEFYTESFLVSRLLAGADAAYPRDLFDTGNARYNDNRPEIAKQLAARDANILNALKP